LTCDVPIRLLLVTALAVACLGACENGSPRDAGAFCERLRADRELVVSGVATGAAVTTALNSFRELGRLAPASIADDWDELTLLVERASEARDNPADRMALARQAAAALPAATAVADYSKNICGVELPVPGPPTTALAVPGSQPATTKAP
jgi:hypothetical protein